MTWDELKNEVGRLVYVIEMAEGMVTADVARKQWDAYFALVAGRSHVNNHLGQIDRTVGSALIALKEMGLVRYESGAEAPLIKYRVIWRELISGEMIPFSGRVCTFEQAFAEAQSKRCAYNYHAVFIEAWTAGDSPWPRPWELETEAAV